MHTLFPLVSLLSESFQVYFLIVTNIKFQFYVIFLINIPTLNGQQICIEQTTTLRGYKCTRQYSISKSWIYIHEGE